MAYGQHVTLNDSTESFGLQVATLLENTRNAEATSIGQGFQALWPASFSSQQQAQVIDIAVRLQKKKYAEIPFQRDFFGALTSGVSRAGLSGTKLDNYLAMLVQSFDKSSPRNFARELVNLRMFFEHEALHFTKYNSLYASNANYDFEYIEQAAAQTYEETLVEEAKSEEGQEDVWGDDTTDDGWGDNSSDDGWSDGWGDDEDSSDESNSGWGVEDDSNEASTDDAVLLTFDETVLSSNLPEKEGAVITFEKVDLIISTQYDSTALIGTKGTFLLDKYIFIGEGGNFDWTSVGMDSKALFVQLETYSFNTRNPYLEANNANLHYADKLDKEAKGYFEFKSVRHDSVRMSKYPRFISYGNDVSMSHLGDENLQYTGGIAIEGKSMIGASAYGQESQMEYKNADGKKFMVRSKLFNFQDTVITSIHSKVTVYQGRDSIFHPSVKTRFYTNSKRFVAIKDKNGFSVRPFEATYYNMSIDADMIDWDMNTDSLNISILNAKSMLPAYFKSGEYFDNEEIKELTGVYNFNPLMVAYSYGAKRKTREFYVADLVNDLKLNEKAVKGAMEHLMYLDFIDYEEIGGRIYLKEKALHFVRSKNNKKDYDDLLIPSLSIKKPNATLHLDTKDLVVRGIDKFFISEILDVYIYPKDNEIKLLKNRDFVFDGQLFAGNFEFVGRNFTFRYDSFLVDLQNIDSVKFYVEGEGQYERKKIDNKLVSLEMSENNTGDATEDNSTNGTLYINHPDNKSGRKIFPQYPNFDAAMGAVVYYDGEETLGGAYDKSVYFVVPPFGIDSLSSNDPEAIGFEGTFVTGGMLPEFKQKLKIMADNSLGFDHTIPDEGFDLYGGPGKLYNKIQLDKNGLVASGKVDYLTSSSYSDNYVLYLDSMVAEGTNFKIEEGNLNGILYPDIYTENFKMKWMPKEDHMIIKNELDSFQLYNNTAKLSGFIDLTPTGVNGGGTMTTRGFETQSEEFSFAQNNLMAKHSIFELASDNSEKPLLAGNDIRLEFDFDRDIADISPEIEGVAAIDFPYAQIKTSISKAKWNLKEQKIYMTKPEDIDIENSYFYATREELDSLAFNAESAVYDIPTSELKVSGIPYIIVADAMITPENNEVLILENAQIGELYNTTIVIDTLNAYHRLVNGTIQIHSRKDFSGSATYEFVNAIKDTFNIKLGEFEPWKDPEDKNATLQTMAKGKIAGDDRFLISEGIFYKGDVTMYARQRALELDGYIRFNLQSRENYDTWIKYSSMDEETQDVMFNFNEAVTESGELLNSGLHYGSTSNELYARFAEEKKSDLDEDFFKPDGLLYFNSEKGMFMIEDTAKINGNKYKGKVFGYNDATGALEFEGPVNFIEPIENVTLSASGIGSGNVNDGSFQINSLLKFDYKLPDQALTLMGKDLFEVLENFGAPEAENDPDAFLYKVSEIIGEKATQEYDKRNKEEYIPIASFTSKMAGSLVFSKVNMEWSPTHNAWYSKDKVGLSNILRMDINALLDGFIEIKRSTELGIIMNIFIQASSDSWYYFGFQDNRLSIYSSNDEFVDIIASKSNINKAGFGEYAFVDVDLPDVLKFVDRFRLEYLGIKDPYEIRMPVEEVSENLDFLEIPVDNTEDGDTIPMEIEDNTEKSLTESEPKKEEKPQTEEDLLNPVTPDKPATKQDEDLGF